jgi:hypothetical protein
MLSLLFPLLAEIYSAIYSLRERLDPPPKDSLISYRIDYLIWLAEPLSDYLIDSLMDYLMDSLMKLDSAAIDSLMADS